MRAGGIAVRSTLESGASNLIVNSEKLIVDKEFIELIQEELKNEIDQIS